MIFFKALLIQVVAACFAFMASACESKCPPKADTCNRSPAEEYCARNFDPLLKVATGATREAIEFNRRKCIANYERLVR